MTKETYKDAINKHKVRDELLSKVKLSKIIGLGGPDINEYYLNMKNKGFKEIKSYEKDRNVFLYQLSQNPMCQIQFGDINYIEAKEKIFYDLDYCCTINSVSLDFLNRTDNFIATFSVRGLGFDKTKQIIKNKLIKPGYSYRIRTYKDSSPMLCLLKIKNK